MARLLRKQPPRQLTWKQPTQKPCRKLVKGDSFSWCAVAGGLLESAMQDFQVMFAEEIRSIYVSPGIETERHFSSADDFNKLASEFLASSARIKPQLRVQVVDYLSSYEPPMPPHATFLHKCVTSKHPSRLDDAIDVLANPMVDLAQLLPFLHLLGDDGVYSLILAAAQGRHWISDLIVPWALSSDDENLREAAVMALARIGGRASMEALQRVARDDADSHVRDAATQCVRDADRR